MLFSLDTLKDTLLPECPGFIAFLSRPVYYTTSTKHTLSRLGTAYHQARDEERWRCPNNSAWKLLN